MIDLEKIFPGHARVMEAVLRGIAGDIIQDRNGDEILFSVKGKLYSIKLEKV